MRREKKKCLCCSVLVLPVIKRFKPVCDDCKKEAIEQLKSTGKCSTHFVRNIEEAQELYGWES